MKRIQYDKDLEGRKDYGAEAWSGPVRHIERAVGPSKSAQPEKTAAPAPTAKTQDSKPNQKNQ